MKLTRYISIAGMVLLLIACSEEVKVTPFSYPQIFTGEVKKTWVIRSVQLLQDGKGTQTFGLDDCVLDDRYEFYNNFERTYRIVSGGKKCDADEPETLVDSNWSFVNASATLTILMPLIYDQPLPFIMKEVDNTKMVIDVYLDQAGTSAYRFNLKPAAGE